MTTESKELAFMPPRETAMQVFTTKDALSPYLAHVRAEIDAFKPDLTTKKGRDAIASMAYKVSQSKSALETLGKALADEAKEIPKKIDASRKAMKDTLDLWRDEVRKPLDDWEAEQQAIEAKRLADEAAAELQRRAEEEAAALLVKIESDHELALLMYAEHVRKQEEAAKAAEQTRIDNEARIAREAAELATKLANEAAEKAILDAKLATETAQREKAEAEARELKAKADADAAIIKAKQDAELATKLAAEKAERDRVQAIEDERARVTRENNRLAEIKRQEDFAAEKLAANQNHRKAKNKEVIDDLIKLGCTKELAIVIVTAMMNKDVRNAQINY